MSSVNIEWTYKEINFPNVLSFCLALDTTRALDSTSTYWLEQYRDSRILSSVCRRAEKIFQLQQQQKKEISNDSLSLSKYSMGKRSPLSFVSHFLGTKTVYYVPMFHSFVSFVSSRILFFSPTQISTFFSLLLLISSALLLPSFLWLKIMFHILNLAVLRSLRLHLLDSPRRRHRCLSTCFIAPSNSRLCCLLFFSFESVVELERSNTTHSIQHTETLEETDEMEWEMLAAESDRIESSQRVSLLLLVSIIRLLFFRTDFFFQLLLDFFSSPLLSTSHRSGLRSNR